MHDISQPDSGSFRSSMDELITRLAHEGVLAAATPKPSGTLLPQKNARCPESHNRALFDWHRP